MRKQMKVLIEITQDVYWEDWGTDRLAFRKGWTGEATAHYEEGSFVGISGESPLFKGVCDEIREKHYKVLKFLEGE